MDDWSWSDDQEPEDVQSWEVCAHGLPITERCDKCGAENFHEDMPEDAD